MSWYGLIVDSKIMEIKPFTWQPHAEDFDYWGSFPGDPHYEVAELVVSVLRKVKE